MFYLYILKSIRVDRHYIGISDDPKGRLAKHNSGSVKSTKGYRPWTLIYTEEFQDKTKARKQELYLKNNFQARKELFDKIDNMPSSSNG